MEDTIEKVVDWMPVLAIPSKDSKSYKSLGGALEGCYQFALAEDIDEIGDNIIHEKIGYTGRGSDVISRSGSVRAPKGNHGVRHFIDQNGIDREEIRVRYLVTNSSAELENYIHEKTSEIASHEFRFAWKEASGGIDGTVTYILSQIQDLTHSSQITEIVQKARQIGMDKYISELNDDTI